MVFEPCGFCDDHGGRKGEIELKKIMIFMALAGVSLFGCGGDDSDGDSGGGGAAPCTTSSDCPSGHACIQVGPAPAGCVPTCSVSGSDCSGSAECAGVGLLEVNVCQPEPDPMNPPSPEEQPKIPCQVDADCAAAHPNAICAEWRGARDCTIPCMNEQACDPPSFAGITLDFSTCTDDERTDKMRTACLPREECFNNPLNCISGFPGGGDLPGPGDIPGGGDLPGVP
ncbi:MAG: hypothetical protein CMH52_14255 [Myxococcales bacterium]|nr:hypothetical protein [Myxococcales bacterium]